MNDIVNEYFKRFYPAKLDQHKFEFDSSLGGMERYTGEGQCIFPAMKCADGFKMSVQGHYGAYSQPRDDFADKYTAVEVGFPNAREELLMPFIDGGQDSDPLQSVYGYVPIEVIAAIVEKHGGLEK
jgi:hypothetical protein